MKISPEELEQIEAFLNNELPAAAQAIFAERLEADGELRSKVEEVRLLQIGIAEQVLSTRLDDYHNSMGTADRPSPVRVVSLAKKLLVAAAVLLLIGLPAWWILGRQNGGEKLYSDYYTADPGLITSMSVSGNYVFEKAMVDYKNREYAKAIPAWKELQAQQPGSDTLRYFLGAAYQANGNIEEALAQLEKVAANPSAPFYQDACWYAGLAWLKKGDKEKAAAYIKKSGYPKSEDLLKKLTR